MQYMGIIGEQISTVALRLGETVDVADLARSKVENTVTDNVAMVTAGTFPKFLVNGAN